MVQFFLATVLPCCHASLLPCYRTSLLPCFGASMLLCSMLWCFGAWVLWLWCFRANFVSFVPTYPPPPSPSQSPPKISVIFCLGSTKYLCCGKNQSKPNACIIAYAWCVDDADALGWGILICARAQGRR
jgi:hypothetical protein